jgi:hypothetical protein
MVLIEVADFLRAYVMRLAELSRVEVETGPDAIAVE